jgi:regulatory protein
MAARRTRRRPGRAEPRDPERDLGPEADPESVARTIVLTKLTAQPRSRAELADALAVRGVPEQVAARVLDRFEEVGLVDDAAYADTWIRSRQRSRGLSRRALGHELRHKGVADDVISQSLAAIDPATEEDAARELVARKLRTMGRLDRAAKARRLTGLLARKGYGAGLASRVVRDALAAADQSSTELEPGWDEPGLDP